MERIIIYLKMKTVGNIRKKLGSRPGSNNYILNELGVGYRMIDEDGDSKPLDLAAEEH